MRSQNQVPEKESISIAVRAFVHKANVEKNISSGKKTRNKVTSPSDWVLIFDTETTTDASQNLRFGTYQVRKKDELKDSGIFYSTDSLTKTELKLLESYAKKNQLTLITVEEFIEKIFYGVGYHYRATIVGFNLPFDLSRLAIEHSTARASSRNKIMQGGFSFKLSENPELPRIQIKHISSRDAFIQFTAPKKQRTSRSDRKKGRKIKPRRGYFIDCKTLAAALTSQSHSLDTLGKALGVESQKQSTEEHGQKLTQKYIEYAIQDTQTTWECYQRLHLLFRSHGLSLTEAHNIHSEASLGKAYLKEMGIQPWRELQPDFPDEILGYIMSAYYGGRSEVHIRKTQTQVLYTDFLSMYPTVCTLMGLWQFVTAEGMTWHDSTNDTKLFLDNINLDDLNRREIWPLLTTLVQVQPDQDIFPVRAKYGGDAQYTIGLNYLTSETPLWYTLADCIASKLLTGKCPRIVRTLTFTPMERQQGLQPVNVAGNPNFRVDPTENDFFKRVIDLRRQVKEKMKTTSPEEKHELDTQQLALKILANATSYGIFVELNVEKEKVSQPLLCYGCSETITEIKKNKFETTGKYFHPLLATLITGAARLMLACTERLITDRKLDWAFCDTDSMALAKPEGMNDKIFYKKAEEIRNWFTPLNPYSDNSSILKIEDYNYSQNKPDELEPLFCYAISSKRYALFNMNKKKPFLRKVSAHGLGHLIAPYQDNARQTLEGSLPWQQDLWIEIIQAGIDNRQPNYSKLKNFDQPALSRYGATTPQILKWCDGINEGKPYNVQIKPFNFLLIPQADSLKGNCKPITPFHKNHKKALHSCIDRETGKKISENQLKTYLQSVAQYHLHPETKFLNGDYMDSEKTERRHIIVQSIQHIGKEANKWEEQIFIGFNPDAQIEYGLSEKEKNEALKLICKEKNRIGTKKIAAAMQLSERYVLGIIKGEKRVSNRVAMKIFHAK